MSPKKDTNDSRERLRSTALRHASDLEEKKRLQARVTDLVLEAFDLPTSPDADPASPQQSDLKLFRQCLQLFQPKDFDDLVYERNIDDRCGYALCPKPNVKVESGGSMVWNRRAGKDFKLVAKADVEKWCSDRCGERAAFVCAQLSTEPAWLRESSNLPIRLLDEVEAAVANLESTQDVDDGMAEKLQALSLERGELNVKDAKTVVSLVEKMNELSVAPAPQPVSGDLVEGHKPKTVRFAEG